MANYTTFIDTNYLFEEWGFDKNIDPKILDPLIVKIQDAHIEPVLGTTLFQKLMDDISNDTLSNQYKTLVEDYIMKAMASWVEVYSKSKLNYRPTNKNVAKKSSEYSQASELNEIEAIKNEDRYFAENYTDKITKYICINITLFPEYFNYTNLVTTPPIHNHFIGGMYIGGNRNWDNNDLRHVRY